VLVGGLGLAVALVIIGATLAGGPAPAPQISGPGTLGSPRPINVILRDYRFDPTPVHLVAGEVVRLNVVNGGLVEHELALGDPAFQAAWAVADAQQTAPAPFATAPAASVDPGLNGVRVVVASGASAIVDYVVPDSGPVELICHLPGHAERGMVGEVVLRADY
jgi:uncharacterized cupredoxin-like copper-binding protein